jgi:hypothetical protein
VQKRRTHRIRYRPCRRSADRGKSTLNDHRQAPLKQLSCQHPFALSIYTVVCIFTAHTRREHSPRHHRNGNTACYWMWKTVLTPALWRQRGAGEVPLQPCCRQGRRNRSKIHRNKIYPKQNLLGAVSLLPDHGALATLQLLLMKQRFLLTSCSRLRHSLQRAAQGLSQVPGQACRSARQSSPISRRQHNSTHRPPTQIPLRM